MTLVRKTVFATVMVIGAGISSAQAHGHPSGGAPSPEINAMLGLMLAGGTVAFLRRRKNGKTESAS